MSKFSHTDEQGRAKMVDVSAKPNQRRRAVASGEIFLAEETIALIRDNAIKKGDVLTVAQIAGIGAAKQTGSLIPLCHPLGLDNIDVQLTIKDKSVEAVSIACCTGKTGVEMEALTAVSVALLAVYDMCKAVDKNMIIGEIKLLEKVKEDV
ncbi:MAG: cyclic pyranopterin monophosphate synthase MoaC [Planctomycetes bacterium]|nr:cyclic pyranopterin monophosphate synthase MoaC [Planctomycetota bacterium]